MHANEIGHLNLNCDHVIHNSKSNSVKIIGFSSSSLFCSKRGYSPKLAGKDLHDLSPEQTRRVNQQIDFCSDFYSLGIIFYCSLAGKHPFQSPNTMEIV